MMTKKDFEAIASALGIARRVSLGCAADHDLKSVAAAHATAMVFTESVVVVLAGSNPNFDRERFILAVDWEANNV